MSTIYDCDTDPGPFAFDREPGAAPGMELIPPKYRQYGLSWRLQHEHVGMQLYTFYGDERQVLKILSCGENEEMFRRAVKECRITDALRGVPGVVWLLDCVIDPEKKTVALLEEMETPLPQYLSQNRVCRADVVKIGTGILDSLIRIRKAGYAHMDVHPGNFYFNHEGIKTGDFGSALKLEEVKDFHELTGAKAFMAPEVWKDRSYSEQSELYGAGMILYWILNHCNPPFRPIMTEEEAFTERMAGKPLPKPQFLLKYPEALQALYKCVERMIAFEPEKRYGSLQEARQALALTGYDYYTESIEPWFLAGIGDSNATIMSYGYNGNRTDRPPYGYNGNRTDFPPFGDAGDTTLRPTFTDTDMRS